MKFNWRANWEILLVLVIIVVGIVITTIAAIKNKDNHLLTLPEETDFGPLLAGSGGPESNNSLSQPVDLQFTSDIDDHPTRKPPIKGTRTTGHSATREQHTNSNSGGGLLTGGRQSKFDDNTDYARPGSPEQQLVTGLPDQINASGSGSNHDSYDALSTEATPSQVRTGSETGGSSAFAPNGIRHHQHHNHLNQHHYTQHQPNGRHFSGSRRHLNRTTNASNQLNDDSHHAVMNMHSSPYADSLGDSADLIDDIHTTRSSLAGPNDVHHGKGSNVATSADQTPLSLQAPYGAMPTNSMSQLNQILLHNSNGKLDPSSTLIDSDDLLSGPYSRLHSANGANNSNLNSLTEAILRDYNLAAALSNANSSQPNSQLLSSDMLANLIGSQVADSSSNSDPFNQSPQQQQQQQPTPAKPLNQHHRGYSSAWPISVLLNDLLKLTTRPAQQLSNALTGGGGSTGGSGDQSNRGSILQQSRLPGTLLSLLQGFSPNSANNHELNLANHDASESSQHYHRVSMSPTDIHSILARSLSNSNVLPAYPAPKGTPQTWIPPTQGGSIDFSSAASRNADLVASNVAGFIRNPGSNQQQLNGANEQPSHQQYPTQQQQQQQQQQLDSYQRASNDNAFYNQQTGEQNSGQQNSGLNNVQQQSQNSFGATPIEPQMVPVDHARHANSQQVMYPPISSQLVSNLDRSWPAGSPNNGGSFAVVNRQNNLVHSNDLDNRQQPAAFKQAAGQQNTLLPQQDYNNYMNFHQAQNLATQTVSGGIQSTPLFNLASNTNTGQQIAHHHKSVGSHNQAPMYSNNNNNQLPSEMPVPLGYNSPMNSQPQVATQPRSFEHSNVEASLSKLSLTPGVGGTISSVVPAINKQQPQARHLKQQQIVNQQSQLINSGAKQQQQVLTRRRRAVVSHTREDMGREDEVMSSKYNANDDEDDGDSRPISVVRPDGRPMNSGRVRSFPSAANEENPRESSSSSANDRQVAQSQRSANHLDLKQRSPSHNRYSPAYTNQNSKRTSDNMLPDELGNLIEQQTDQQDSRSNYKNARRAFDELKKGNKNSLDTAGSRLMSKLLGTASTNDEMEDDMDDDEDPASEKRKEELDDAEFGIVNDERHNRPSSEGPTSGSGSSLDGPRHSDKSSLRPAEAGDSGSGSTDNEAYVRRHQQRSDIEFYGHPGEETRQLKYGILGSGNYEVVNGGIYPEADESTAAVNSVANYVRKPMLANLPKILAGEPVNPQTAFMPGGRVGGFMRGASNMPSDELIGLMPGDIGKHLTSPLLELIDANTGEQLGFDPNLIAQLGSSGSSARSTHAIREPGYNRNNDEDQIENGDTSNRKQRDGQKGAISSVQDENNDNSERLAPSNGNRKRNKKDRNKMSAKDQHEDSEASLNEEEDDDNRNGQFRSTKDGSRIREPNELHSNRLDKQKSSLSGSRSQGTNQFNSYQLLPSKKVTIYSDQDLDSAPSEQSGVLQQQHQFPLPDTVRMLQLVQPINRRLTKLISIPTS